MAGLHSLVPAIPKRAAASAEEEDNGDYADYGDLSQCISSSQEQSNSVAGSRELGYKEWLLESAAHYEEGNCGDNVDDHRQSEEARDVSGDQICDDVEKEEAATAEESAEAAPVPEVHWKCFE